MSKAGMSNTGMSDPSAAGEHADKLFPVGHLVPFVLVTALFFLWGIPNNLNDVLIRQFMKSFAISRFQAGLVQSAFYMGYFLLAHARGADDEKSWVQGWICYRFGPVRVGTFLFWPAALIGRYGVFSAGVVCHRQRTFVSGDGFEPFHCATGRSGEFRTTTEFLPGI